MSLIVDDIDDAIAFFVDVIGFQLVEDSPSMANDGTRKRWVVVQPPGGQTGVLLAQARGDRQVAGIGEQFVGRVGLFLTVDDFEEQYERMLAGGVQFTSEPRTEPYGQVAVGVTSRAISGIYSDRPKLKRRAELASDTLRYPFACIACGLE